MSSVLERRTRRKGPAFRKTPGPSTPSSWNSAWRVSTPAARITAWGCQRAGDMLRAAYKMLTWSTAVLLCTICYAVCSEM